MIYHVLIFAGSQGSCFEYEAAILSIQASLEGPGEGKCDEKKKNKKKKKSFGIDNINAFNFFPFLWHANSGFSRLYM